MIVNHRHRRIVIEASVGSSKTVSQDLLFCFEKRRFIEHTNIDEVLGSQQHAAADCPKAFDRNTKPCSPLLMLFSSNVPNHREEVLHAGAKKTWPRVWALDEAVWQNDLRTHRSDV